MTGIDISCGCCGDSLDSLEQDSDRGICQICFFLEEIEQHGREEIEKQL